VYISKIHGFSWLARGSAPACPAKTYRVETGCLRRQVMLSTGIRQRYCSSWELHGQLGKAWLGRLLMEGAL
jgi:hypothetical protein